jgi:hypothetical protein
VPGEEAAEAAAVDVGIVGANLLGKHAMGQGMAGSRDSVRCSQLRVCLAAHSMVHGGMRLAVQSRVGRMAAVRDIRMLHMDSAWDGRALMADQESEMLQIVQ